MGFFDVFRSQTKSLLVKSWALDDDDGAISRCGWFVYWMKHARYRMMHTRCGQQPLVYLWTTGFRVFFHRRLFACLLVV